MMYLVLRVALQSERTDLEMACLSRLVRRDDILFIYDVDKNISRLHIAVSENR